MLRLLKRTSALFAVLTISLLVFTPPALAHNDSCTGWSNTACDVVMVFEGGYVDITSRWCETSGGWIDVRSITLDTHFGGGAGTVWRPVLYNNSGNPVWTGNFIVGDNFTETWVVGADAAGEPNSFPKLPKGSGLYLRVEMDPVVGLTTYWRQTPLHDEPPHAPYDAVDYSNEFSNGTYDCSQ